MFLIGFAFAWDFFFFTINKKLYPNYIYFSTSTHTLFSARPIHPTGLSCSHTFSGKLPVTTHPQGSLSLPSLCPGPHVQLLIPSNASFIKSLAFHFLFPLYYHLPKPYHITSWTWLSCLLSVSPSYRSSCINWPNKSKNRLLSSKPATLSEYSVAPYCWDGCNGQTSDSAREHY